MAIKGYEERLDFLEWLMSDSVVPALCSNGCRVEPDGKCPHGNPSPLKVMGMY